MISDGKTVGFVTQSLQQKQAGCALPEIDRVLAPGQEKALFAALHHLPFDIGNYPAFGDPHRPDATAQVEFLQHRGQHPELPLAAVDQNHVRQFVLINPTLQTTLEDFVKGGVIICSDHGLDAETPILGRSRLPVNQNHHAADREMPLDVGDIKTLDPLRRRRQLKLKGQILENLVPGLLALAPLPVGFGGVALGEQTEAFFFAALRCYQLHPAPALFTQPLTQQGTRLKRERQQQLIRHDDFARIIFLQKPVQQFR